MSIRTKTCTTHYVDAEDDGDFEIQFDPVEHGMSPFIKVIGNKAVVGYLSYDSDAENPLTGCEGNGSLFLINDRNSIWHDPGEVRQNLRCNTGRWEGDQPDIDVEFVLNGAKVTCRELAADAHYQRLSESEEDMTTYLEHLEIEMEGDTTAESFAKNQKLIVEDLTDENGLHEEAVADLARELFSKHWKLIVEPFVVPVSYQSERGSTRIWVTTWDGDWDDLPDGVWVACTNARENILWPYFKDHLVKTGVFETQSAIKGYPVSISVYELRDGDKVLESGLRGFAAWASAFMCYLGPRYRDAIRTGAEEYAKTVVQEVSRWADGDCYGCCVAVYERSNPEDTDEVPTWEPSAPEESCWNFIGFEYAEETLKSDFFDPLVSKLEADATKQENPK